jgi:hypothetical protein
MRMRSVIDFLAGLIVTGCLLGQEARISEAAVRPKGSPDFGTSDRSYVRVSAVEFTPANSSCGYFGSVFGRYPADPSCFMYASFHVPGGALLKYLEFDYCDTSSPNLGLEVFECDNEGQDCSLLVGVLASSGSPGCTFTSTSSLSHLIDNYHHIYLLLAAVGASDGTNLIEGAIIGYTLQVSPPPASATFPDVPTSDFGFQYVEALAASGITGGCGGGNYCPDNFVTRRQMAIFIAKALGLHWAGY